MVVSRFGPTNPDKMREGTSAGDRQGERVKMKAPQIMTWLSDVDAWVVWGALVVTCVVAFPHALRGGAPGVIAVALLALAAAFGLVMIVSRGLRLRAIAKREANAMNATIVIPCRGASRRSRGERAQAESGPGFLLVISEGDERQWRELGSALRWSIHQDEIHSASIEQTIPRLTYPMLVLKTDAGTRYEYYLQKQQGWMWRYGTTLGEARETLSQIIANTLAES